MTCFGNAPGGCSTWDRLRVSNIRIIRRTWREFAANTSGSGTTRSTGWVAMELYSVVVVWLPVVLVTCYEKPLINSERGITMAIWFCTHFCFGIKPGDDMSQLTYQMYTVHSLVSNMEIPGWVAEHSGRVVCGLKPLLCRVGGEDAACWFCGLVSNWILWF